MHIALNKHILVLFVQVVRMKVTSNHCKIQLCGIIIETHLLPSPSLYMISNFRELELELMMVQFMFVARPSETDVFWLRIS